jgi:hypothetical protein
MEKKISAGRRQRRAWAQHKGCGGVGKSKIYDAGCMVRSSIASIDVGWRRCRVIIVEEWKELSTVADRGPRSDRRRRERCL